MYYVFYLLAHILAAMHRLLVGHCGRLIACGLLYSYIHPHAPVPKIRGYHYTNMQYSKAKMCSDRTKIE